MVRAFVPSTMYTDPPLSRAIFGIGESPTSLNSGSQAAYIGLQNDDLIGYTYDGITEKKIEVTDFVCDYEDKVFESVLTRDSSGSLKLYLNSILIGTLTGSATPISSSYVVMGNGHSTGYNIDCTIYEAHVFNTELTANKVKSMFYGGVKNSDTTLIASYTSPNLNPGPTQWLDSSGTNHILLPVSGAAATNPDKEFSISDLVFSAAPKINAAGRIEHGKKAVELLITEDTATAEQILLEINAQNSRRKDLDQQMTSEALAFFESNAALRNAKSTVLFKKEWQVGAIPTLWDGKAAERIINVLLNL
jgi:hypothetical protein